MSGIATAIVGGAVVGAVASSKASDKQAKSIATGQAISATSAGPAGTSRAFSSEPADGKAMSAAARTMR